MDEEIFVGEEIKRECYRVRYNVRDTDAKIERWIREREVKEERERERERKGR